MMRASGAMLTITALQMATASLAAPKSVMKTMVGCGAVAAALPLGVPPNFPHEAFVSAIVARAAASKKRRLGMGRVPRKKTWNYAERGRVAAAPTGSGDPRQVLPLHFENLSGRAVRSRGRIRSTLARKDRAMSSQGLPTER